MKQALEPQAAARLTRGTYLWVEEPARGHPEPAMVSSPRAGLGRANTSGFHPSVNRALQCVMGTLCAAGWMASQDLRGQWE